MDGDVKVPFNEAVRQIAREAARAVIEEHVERCPIREVERRVRRVEIVIAALAVLVGAGQVVGPLLARVVGG